MLRGLKKADVKHAGVSLLWSYALVVHQCQQKTLGIPQHCEFVAPFFHYLKIENRAEELLQSGEMCIRDRN